MKYPDTLYTYCTYISLLQWSRRLQGSGWTNIATHRWQLAPDMIRDSNLHQSGISVWPRGDTLKCLLVFALSSHFWVLLYSESKHWNSLQKIICVKDYTFAMDTRQQSSCLIDGDHFSYCIHIGSVSCQLLVAFEIAKSGGRRNIPTRKFMNPGRRSYYGAGRFLKNQSLTHSPSLFLTGLLYNPIRRPFVCRGFKKVRLSNPDGKFSPIR